MKVRWKFRHTHAGDGGAFASTNLPAKHHLVATQNLKVSDGRWTDHPVLRFALVLSLVGGRGGRGGDLAPSLHLTLHPPPSATMTKRHHLLLQIATLVLYKASTLLVFSFSTPATINAADAVDRTSPAEVKQIFDNFAPSFESKLVDYTQIFGTQGMCQDGIGADRDGSPGEAIRFVFGCRMRHRPLGSIPSPSCRWGARWGRSVTQDGSNGSRACSR